MSEITLSCNRCGSSITTHSVAEAVKWDVSHDEVCTAASDDTRKAGESDD